MTAYRNGQEHLHDELAWLNEALKSLLEAGGGQPLADPAFFSVRGLVVSKEELADPSADGTVFSAREDGASRWEEAVSRRQAAERAIALRAEAAMRAGVSLPLAQLCGRLRLTVLERRCVVLCLAAETSRSYEKWFSYLNDDATAKWPTPDLAVRLLCDRPDQATAVREMLAGSGPLRALLLEQEDTYGGGGASLSRPRLKSALKLDERTVSFLLATERIDARLAGIASGFEPEDALPPLPSKDAVRDRLQALAERNEGDSVPFVHLWGQAGGGKKLRMRYAAASRGQRLLVVRTEGVPSDSERVSIALHRVVREALLTGAALCVAEEHASSGAEVANLPEWKKALSAYAAYSRRPLLSWTSNVRRQPSELPLPERATWLAGEVAVPEANIRAAFWGAELSQAPEGHEWPEGLDRKLADKYRFTPGQIADAWQQAAAFAAGVGGVPTPEELDAASRGQFRHRLAQLADRIEPARSWADLVLQDEPLSLLQEACSRFRHRETVFERWGFGRKLPYGRGLSLLFAGPPGTGKTMSAEIVAAELGLELYRIDLSRIVSKYIGETEQRLSELFAEAEHSGAILFFDEGDALFGKRTEVKDAHDKYANLEAAYLLQRIEAYDGVSILATNLIQNLDEALIRRMSFIVKFPFPDATERARIFRAHLPPEAPLSEDLDLEFLASRLDVSGGYIKNIVLAGAFLAAAEDKPIGMSHLVRSARQELVKMGKILVKESFAPY
ncbi:ATP-binding protein [Cohnella faecalis]|uniref:ATP-binding protein n=1 Tax=Cohnella faecalis TaxID=2315694 RepID=A0A398CMV7_9BACL|nr:ATP-binding protein [Cohnella faecalis]RIE02579.1 ATP-binding protein [Cohnella faecalis]